MLLLPPSQARRLFFKMVKFWRLEACLWCFKPRTKQPSKYIEGFKRIFLPAAEADVIESYTKKLAIRDPAHTAIIPPLSDDKSVSLKWGWFRHDIIMVGTPYSAVGLCSWMA